MKTGVERLLHDRDLRAPLAIAVIGGLVSSTLLTLVVVPSLYSLVEHRVERFRG